MNVIKSDIKNANGMGCVYKLSGNRRRPWVACVTESIERITQEKKYKQRRKIIGYFENEEEATYQLWTYNRNPILYDKLVALGSLTFANVYEEWAALKFNHISQTAINGYKAAFANCKDIHQVCMCDLKTMHFQSVMNRSTLSLASDQKLKTLMVLVSEYAMQNDIINKNYAKYVMINKKELTDDIHKPFNENEIDLLFRYDFLPYVDTILIMIYTGFRVGELLSIKHENLDLRYMTLRGGSKSEAGKNRVVPLHPKVQDYVMNYYNLNKPYLFCDIHTGEKLSYHQYRKLYFDDVMRRMHLNHLPHDCRHTFATRLSNSGANTTSIKKMIGHASYETTEKVYTHKDITQLRKAINFLD